MIPPREVLFYAWVPIVGFLIHVSEALAALDPREVAQLVVTSWWRDVDANVAAGGNRLSGHLMGLALDLDGPDTVLARLQAAAEAGGLGTSRSTFLHVQATPPPVLERSGVLPIAQGLGLVEV